MAIGKTNAIRSGSSPNLQQKTANASATGQVNVTPDTGYDGLSKVIVPMVTQSREGSQSEIQQSSIIEGVTILGKVGTAQLGKPINVATAAGMTAVLISANLGKVYKFTGTTDSDYTNGELYEVVDE